MNIQNRKKYAEAMIFAFHAHSGHFRKESREVYTTHLIKVSESVNSHFPNHKKKEILRICALLHDTIEDTWVTKQVLEKKFGKEVAEIVDMVSKRRNPDRKKQESDFANQVSNASDEAKIIKLLDIKDNVEDVKDYSSWKPFLKDSEQMLKGLELKGTEGKKEFEFLKKQVLKTIKDNLII